VANVSWTMMFDVVEVSVLAQSTSDHHPIVVDFSNNKDIR
jgi:endonuclease/exonuclease/phosphatase (EEP) superfamily protein YafD